MFSCTRNFQFWPFYGLLLVFSPFTETRPKCASKEHISSREITMSCSSSEDLQRRIQLFSSNTNQRCLLAWRTLLQWTLPTLPPPSLLSRFRDVAASPQPRQMSLVPPNKQWLVMVYYLGDRKWFQLPDRFWSREAASYFSSLLPCKTCWLLGAPLPRGSGDGFNSLFAAGVHEDSSELKPSFQIMWFVTTGNPHYFLPPLRSAPLPSL